MAVPNIEEIKRRKALMQAAGLPIINDTSWGSWQDGIWQKYLASHLKTLPTSTPTVTVQRASRKPSFGGFLLDTWDRITGQNKIQIVYPEGQIRQGPTTNNASFTKVIGLNRADPRKLALMGAGTLGSAVVMANGPELMQSLNEFGQKVKSEILGIPSYLRGIFKIGDGTESTEGEEPEEKNNSTSEKIQNKSEPAASGQPNPPEGDNNQSEEQQNKRKGPVRDGKEREKPSKWRYLWEGKNNNFGPGYKLRNTGRVVVGSATYPGRKALNYIVPTVGEIPSLLFVGKGKFNIPLVANDSTDLLYEGGIGLVNNKSQQKDTTTTDQNINQTDTVESKEIGTQLDSIPTNQTYGLVF